VSDWAPLRKYTSARIGLPRAGTTVSTSELLAFQLAHAQARDAVLRGWDAELFSRELSDAGIESVVVHSCATDRTTYLARPDLGRQLDAESLEALKARRAAKAPDIALIMSDGLSATAVHSHGLPALRALLDAFRRRALQATPIVLVQNGRVALSDVIGEALGARAAVIVLGERPGLSAADSLGIYLTHGPKRGNSDAQRNCISNVREPGGLSPLAAAEQLAFLLTRALEQGVSGVALKAQAAEVAKLPTP
jgi:ethanolamine ammonia-lyase small subunit